MYSHVEYSYFVSYFRLDIRGRVRRLQKDPCEDGRNEVERLRLSLAADLLHLQTFTQIHGVNECAQGFDDDDPNEFDDLDENPRDIPDRSNDGLRMTASTSAKLLAPYAPYKVPCDSK